MGIGSQRHEHVSASPPATPAGVTSPAQVQHLENLENDPGEWEHVQGAFFQVHGTANMTSGRWHFIPTTEDLSRAKLSGARGFATLNAREKVPELQRKKL